MSEIQKDNRHEINVVPWQKVAAEAIAEYQSEKGFIDVGKTNSYIIWARLDMAAYKTATEFCKRYNVQVNNLINAVIHIKLESLYEKEIYYFWSYVKYLFGRNKKYAPLFITEVDVNKYLKWLAKKNGIEFNQ